MRQWLSNHRRHLHQYPELSLKEARTSQYCQEILKQLGYTIKPSWGHGFTADKFFSKEAKTLAFRADMDALPIQEENTHDYCSKHANIAHMCGHDSHMAIALGTAKIFAEKPPQVNVRFLFQPCEETPPGGALGMIEHGCLDGVDEVYGLHNDPGTPVGTIKTRVGHLMAYADRFELTVTGKGCHAARPQDGLDPIAASCELVSQWQRIVSRFIDPTHPAVVTVGAIHGGDTFNVIPRLVNLKGTVRTFHAENRQKIEHLLETSLTTLQQQGFSTGFYYTKGYDAVINHAIGVQRLAQAAVGILDNENIITNCAPQAWGEDFTYYLQHRPGAFFFLGSGNDEINQPLHSPLFDIDEKCLEIGAKIMAQIAYNYQ